VRRSFSIIQQGLQIAILVKNPDPRITFTEAKLLAESYQLMPESYLYN
jgi:phosphoenolpyruvate carboxylase